MKTPLLLGFIALLVLIGANLVLTNRSIGELQRAQVPITESQAVRLDALLRGWRPDLLISDTASLLRTVAKTLGRT